MADCLLGPNSEGKKLALAGLVLGAVAGAGLGWVTTPDFRSNLGATLGAGNPTSTGSSASASATAERPGPIGNIVVSDVDLKRAKGGVARTLADGRPGISQTRRIDWDLLSWVGRS
jgi:hypothetical protein